MLVDNLKRCQADTFALANKAQYYHWNVEGPDFVQYHEFLGELYAELFTAVDGLAEHVRQLDAYAPGAQRMLSETTVPAALAMIRQLASDNETVLEGLALCYLAAEDQHELGLSNHLQGRIEVHNKHRWMLKSITK